MPFFKKSNKRRKVKKYRKTRKQRAGWGSSISFINNKKQTPYSIINSFGQQSGGWGGTVLNSI